MIELVDIKDRTPNPDLIGILEEGLAKAKAGELRSALLIYGWDDGSVSHGWALDPRSGRRMLLSEIVLAQADLVMNIGLEEEDSRLARVLR